MLNDYFLMAKIISCLTASRMGTGMIKRLGKVDISVMCV